MFITNFEISNFHSIIQSLNDFYNLQSCQLLIQKRIMQFQNLLSRPASINIYNHLKTTNQAFFIQLMSNGEKLSKQVKENDPVQFKSIIDALKIEEINFLGPFIDECFESALNFRYEEIIEYILTNKYDVKRVKDSVI